MDSLRAQDRDAWRRWLAKNHRSTKEVWLVLYKKRVRKASVSYNEAVEEALCYGWIDSMMRSVDDESYAQKFTPRKTGSRWSASNLARMEKLIEAGRVAEAGMTIYLNSGRKPEAEELVRYATEVPPDVEVALRTSELAWKNFEAFPASRQNRYILWITSARKPGTRKRRVSEAVRLIEKDSDALIQ